MGPMCRVAQMTALLVALFMWAAIISFGWSIGHAIDGCWEWAYYLLGISYITGRVSVALIADLNKHEHSDKCEK